VISLVIAEKGLAVERHLVDIRKNGSFEPDYIRLNPKGVVPTIVDDGTVVCNSPRIAKYLDAKAGPPLCTEVAESWIAELAEFPLMLFSYSVWVLGRKGERSAAILDDKVERAGRYAEQYPELAQQFIRKRDYFSDFRAQVMNPAYVEEQKQHYQGVLDKMSQAVSTTTWLASEEYSFADAIATSILYRLVDLELLHGWRSDGQHPLSNYFERLQARPSFAAVFVTDPLLAQL
jgi:tetrachloro-p-hydroquinone reductive dehalogenase